MLAHPVRERSAPCLTQALHDKLKKFVWSSAWLRLFLRLRAASQYPYGVNASHETVFQAVAHIDRRPKCSASLSSRRLFHNGRRFADLRRVKGHDLDAIVGKPLPEFRDGNLPERSAQHASCLKRVGGRTPDGTAQA
jgi:hypothetical protein